MTNPSRDDLVLQYLDSLPYAPYPLQEDALLAWFASDQGVLVTAPTGMGKTLIAQGALFEALHTGARAYYTTPLIALTDQKFHEMQDAAERWGFRRDDVGLVTGNRKINPDARVLVVVAEILLNRLLNPAEFDFDGVSAVVMDEFHSFNDPERGIVWELSLSLLPRRVRLLLLSATVGNPVDFQLWLSQSHGRRLDLVQGFERKVPLQFHWVPDELLNEQLERMADGDEVTRRTPTLLFCFNRDECWTVAEQLRGRDLLSDGQQRQLAVELARLDWSQGIGPKLKTVLMRGVGVHHAGVLPKYKRVVEDLFQRKLLSVCVCTETLAAGMNLPARSVLLTTLLKGPPGKKTLIDPSVAHQIFGRAGRPQFDTEGHVYSLAHEDDVKILRFKQKLDQIPEDTRDPLLIRKRKELKKKMPKRRSTEQYWGDEQFQRLIKAPPTKLQSQGVLPWRLLAYLLSLSPEVARIQRAVERRLMEPKQVMRSKRRLIEMLVTLEEAACVTLDPPPPHDLRARLFHLDPDTPPADSDTPSLRAQLRTFLVEERFGPVSGWNPGALGTAAVDDGEPLPEADGDLLEEADDFGLGLDEEPGERQGVKGEGQGEEQTPDVDAALSNGDALPLASGPSPLVSSPAPPRPLTSTLKFLLERQGVRTGPDSGRRSGSAGGTRLVQEDEPDDLKYEPLRAVPSERLGPLLTFKSINPLYGMFLLDVLPLCDGAERIQALESVLEFPGALARAFRIPRPEFLPPSRFTVEFLHMELLQRGAASPAELALQLPTRDEQPEDPADRVWPLTFPEKLLRLFHGELPTVHDVPVLPVWAAGELLHFGGDFNKLVTTRRVARQEGIVFRHVLRFILLCEEFIEHLPDGDVWRDELLQIAGELTTACRRVDPHSTDQMIESARAADPVDGERAAAPAAPSSKADSMPELLT